MSGVVSSFGRGGRFLQALGGKLLVVVVACVLAFNTAHAALSDAIVAIVNDDVITQSELDARVKRVENDVSNSQVNRAAVPGANAEQIRQTVLQTMVEELVQVQLAKQLGIVVSDPEVEQAVSDVANRNQVSLAQLQQKMQAENLDFNAFREEIRTRLLITRLIRARLSRQVSVSDFEIDELLRQQQSEGSEKEYRASHILLKIPSEGSGQQVQAIQAKASRLADLLAKGGNFALVAKENSEAGDAARGGDLGWKTQEQLPEIFVTNLDQMSAGQVSGVIRSPAAFHILKLLAVRGGVKLVEKRRVQHILVRAKTDLERQQAIVQLNKLREDILAGAEFDQLAKSFSDDPGSAAKGGDLGWIVKGQTVPNFEQAVFAAEVDKISQPVQSQFGVHLIKVNEVTTDDVSQEQRRAQAYDQLLRRKMSQQYPAWLSDLVSNAYVSYP